MRGKDMAARDFSLPRAENGNFCVMREQRAYIIQPPDTLMTWPVM
jgi:hypothetical protein